MNVSQQITVGDVVTEQLAVGTATVGVTFPESPSYSFDNGTSTAGTVANVIDLHWEKTAVTLAASASVTYTLSALTDDLTRAVAFARLHRLAIRVTAKSLVTPGDYLTVGNAASNAATNIVSGTGTLKVKDYLLMVWQDAVGVVIGSGATDQLKIVNSGTNSITFEIALTGCST